MGCGRQELLKKRRYGRQQKAMGDYSLLAGSPGDARDHYHTALELARNSSDFIWAGAALEGLAHARVLPSSPRSRAAARPGAVRPP